LIEVHRLFDLRRELTDDQIAEVLRKFVLPSLIPDDVSQAGVHGRSTDQS
jgi:hypothetical protein